MHNRFRWFLNWGNAGQVECAREQDSPALGCLDMKGLPRGVIEPLTLFQVPRDRHLHIHSEQA